MKKSVCTSICFVTISVCLHHLVCVCVWHFKLVNKFWIEKLGTYLI